MLCALEFLGSLTTNGVVPRMTNHHRYHIYGVPSNLYSQYQTVSHINCLCQSELYNNAEGMCKMADWISNVFNYIN